MKTKKAAVGQVQAIQAKSEVPSISVVSRHTRPSAKPLAM